LAEQPAAASDRQALVASSMAAYADDRRRRRRGADQDRGVVAAERLQQVADALRLRVYEVFTLEQE
jgi:hypothetical protein